MDNKIENGKYFYDIEKIIFFNNLKNINVYSNNVLETFKHDFNYFNYIINKKKIDYSKDVLQFLLSKYNKFLEEILLMSSKHAINETIKTLSNILWSKYHIIENKHDTPTIDIQLHLFIKQIILTFSIHIIEFNKKSTNVTKKLVKVNVIFNITNYKYLRIILETM